MTGSLTNWLALKSSSVGRSQHLVSSQIKSWRTREGISVSSVPKCLIPIKPSPGLRIPAIWQVISSTFQSDDVLYICPTTILEWRRLTEDQVSEIKEYTTRSGSWEPSLILKLLQLSTTLTRRTGLMYLSWDGGLLLLLGVFTYVANCASEEELVSIVSDPERSTS